MEEITQDILDDFQDVTKYDVAQFLADYVSFIDTHYPNILNYYSGNSDVVPKNSFFILDHLLIEQSKIIDIIILNASTLDNYKFWILTERIEDIGTALETAENASKWMRSNLTKSGYKNTVSIEYMMKQGQNLEDIDRNELNSIDPDGWSGIALDNDLKEDDYTLDGGKLISVVFKNGSSIFLNSVVDNIDSKEKTYGKDIDKRILIENDDLVTLSYNDTILQSAKILTDLKKGDDPAFPDRGLDIRNILSDLAGISYPTIFRQLSENFATDDSFKSFSIVDISRDRDAINLHYQVSTRAGEVFNNLIPLNG